MSQHHFWVCSDYLLAVIALWFKVFQVSDFDVSVTLKVTFYLVAANVYFFLVQHLREKERKLSVDVWYNLSFIIQNLKWCTTQLISRMG